MVSSGGGGRVGGGEGVVVTKSGTDKMAKEG